LAQEEKQAAKGPGPIDTHPEERVGVVVLEDGCTAEKKQHQTVENLDPRAFHTLLSAIHNRGGSREATSALSRVSFRVAVQAQLAP